jgi:FkbH-like protein
MSSLDYRFSMFEAQSRLFQEHLTRGDLLELELTGDDNAICNINVWRNHAFEVMIPLIEPFSGYGRWQARFHISEYDDSMMFATWREADLELLWIDSSRYRDSFDPDEWKDWLLGRVEALRKISHAPVIIATWLPDGTQRAHFTDEVEAITDTYFADLEHVCEIAGVSLLDERIARLAGSPISSTAQLVLARELACHWIPALQQKRIKAVALDLDNTLYHGVLGEDGIQGVDLSPGHRALQQYVKDLKEKGIFVALVSRNELPDVQALFAQRNDFPLRWEDFSSIQVSWGDKAEALTSVAEDLRISPDAVLFVDDNIGELTSVAVSLPMVHSVLANQDATATIQAMKYYPGLWRWKAEEDDAIRVKDLKANIERDHVLSAATDMADYFRSLQVTLSYFNNPTDQLSRLSDLCNKTNQFNLLFNRYGQTELKAFIESDDVCVTSVMLSDRLTDSGTIAVIIARRTGDQLRVLEVCISCRALGRNLENTIVLHALKDMPIFDHCMEVVFNVRHAPRNQPAISWLSKLLGVAELSENRDYALTPDTGFSDTVADGVTVINN